MLNLVTRPHQLQCELPTGHITIAVDHTYIETSQLFDFAARQNSKRGFLFMSKVLGKHFPSKPKLMRRVHETLSSLINTFITQPIVFIAMAETAVGLGHGVFDSYQSANPSKSCLFLHTTRYRVPSAAVIEFEESHSHAPNQFLHLPVSEHDTEILQRAKAIVLIDDEATTGNTFLNLVNAFKRICPQLEEVHLSVITNFMGHDASSTDVLTDRFGMKTNMGAVLSGSYIFTPKQIHPESPNAQNSNFNEPPYISQLFGRTGLSQRISIKNEFLKKLENEINPVDKILIVGTGEFMHIPYLVGSELDRRGYDVYIQSSTRSPIMEWGGIKNKISFNDNYNEGIANYLYNVNPGQYDKVFIFHETSACESLKHFSKLVNGVLFYIGGEQIEFSNFC